MTMQREGDLFRYLVINPTDEQWGLVCTTVGYQNIAPRSRYPLSRHPDNYNFRSSGRVLNEYQMVYITEGSGWFRSVSVPRAVRVTAGTVIFLFPGEWHTYHPDRSTGWSERWVGFYGKQVVRLCEQGFFSPQEPVLKIGISQTVVRLYDDLIRYAGERKNCHQQLLAGLIGHLLGLIRYKCNNREDSADPMRDRINRACILMNEDTAGILDPEGIAARLGMSYTWFRKQFKKYAGMPPAQYRIRLKLARAKEMLIATDQPVSTVAYEAGFESIGHFCNLFKQQEGMTATEFRDRNRMEYAVGEETTPEKEEK